MAVRHGRGRSVVALAVLSTALAVVAPRAAGAAAPAIAPPTLSVPAAGAATTVQVAVADAAGTPVQLSTVVGFAAPVVQVLHDDGLDGDASAGDGTFTGSIPAQPAGTLVRYRVVVGDVVWPVRDGKRRHAGFVVDRAPVDTQLPVLDWYLAPADLAWLLANRGDKTYVPAVLVVDGVVLDGAEVRNQGGLTAAGSPKPNYKFKLPGSQVLGAPLFPVPVDEFVADADHEDPTYAIGAVAQRLFESAGVPQRATGLARVERNGTFTGVYQLYEELDGTWVGRLGFPVGSMYEAEGGSGRLVGDDDNPLTAQWSEADGDGTYADLDALVQAVGGNAGPAALDALVDRFDLPALVDLLAMSILLQHTDSVATNTLLVRDAASDRWRIVPNDLDLTLGLRGRTRFWFGLGLPQVDATLPIQGEGDLAELVARRIRSLHDEWFADDRLVAAATARVANARPDIAADRAAWPGLAGPTVDAGLADLADFVAHQRTFVAADTARGLVPPAPSPTATAVVSELRAGGDAADLVELANPSAVEAVDLSGWSLAGAAVAELPSGTVIPSGGRIVVPVSPAAVAAREEGVMVAGALAGPLPTGGGTVVLHDADGAPRDRVTWSTGSGWPAPGGSGRSIEARTLDAGRATGAGWQLSPSPGGTPGAAGASARGLQVEAWAGQVRIPVGESAPLRVVVTNAGPGPASAVVVDGPGTTCDRSLGSVPAGTRRVLWCDVTATAPPDGSLARLQDLSVLARSTEQPAGAVDRPRLVTLIGEPVRPALGQGPLRLADGALVGGDRTGTLDPAETWRLEQQFAPTGGAPVAGARRELDATGATVPAPVGVEGLVRLGLRSRSLGAAGVSTFSPPLTARPSRLWPFASPSALVDRWFRDLAGRAPTTGERTLWVAHLAGGGSPADLAVDQLAGERWTDDAHPLVRLYLAHFGRVPDAAGLRYWLGKRRSGTTVSTISQQFTGSSEFARRYAGLDAGEFVDAVYRNVFSRPADPGGLAYWTARVEGGLGRGAVVVAFSESSEGIRRKDPTVEAVVAWFALHGTIASAEWQSRAAAWLADGGDLGTVAESVRSTAAYAPVVG